MPEVEKVFIVKAPQEKVWDFLKDPKKMGSCIPGCEDVKILSETDSEWRIKAKAGFLSKTIVLTTHTTESNPPTRGAWTGEGENIKTSGSVDLKAISDNETEVTYRSSMEASGMVGKIINMISRRTDG